MQLCRSLIYLSSAVLVLSSGQLSAGQRDDYEKEDPDAQVYREIFFDIDSLREPAGKQLINDDASADDVESMLEVEGYLQDSGVRPGDPMFLESSAANLQIKRAEIRELANEQVAESSEMGRRRHLQLAQIDELVELLDHVDNEQMFLQRSSNIGSKLALAERNIGTTLEYLDHYMAAAFDLVATRKRESERTQYDSDLSLAHQYNQEERQAAAKAAADKRKRSKKEEPEEHWYEKVLNWFKP